MRRRILLSLICGLALVAGCDQEQPAGPEVDPAGEDSLDKASSQNLSAMIDSDYGVAHTTRSYEITLENLTPDNGNGASQVFSPPVIASHDPSVRMFRVGHTASAGLAAIAEDAINAPMVGRFEDSSHVHEVQEGDGVIFPGASATYTVHTVASQRRLSMAFMLVNTNDGFSGTDAMRLPRWGEKTVYLHAYDAGSEANTELASDIPGPCCGSPESGTPTKEEIRHHAGIQGNGDLDPEVYGWDGPVAKLTIRRIMPTYEITVENLTPDNGNGAAQVFSPPVIASHNPWIRMWRRGGFASDELAGIAEDAMNGPMIELLEGSRKVHEVVEGGGVIPPGASDTYEITATRRARRVSMAFMLVNTNDGFSGTDALRLPGGGRASYYVGAYDAGSEENTELSGDIPGPCCTGPGEGTATRERIRHHRGILGVGDLDPDTWGWDGPVAKVSITRVK